MAFIRQLEWLLWGLHARSISALAIMTRGVALADENVIDLRYALCRQRR